MKTIALIIGNNTYPGHELTNAINDARAIRDEFSKLGYDIIYIEDGENSDIPKVLDEFDNKLKDYDASLFYFAGHGFEHRGENYLAFIECQLEADTPASYAYSSIKLSNLFEIYKGHSNKVNIVIIDACRKSFERGASNLALTSVSAPKGTMVAFSTSPTMGAKDQGANGHSVYTNALLQFIGRERLSVEELFKKVRQVVFAHTDGTQITWEHTSLIGDFYFNTGIIKREIPYSEDVVKDKYFQAIDTFGALIENMRSSNYYKQGPAIEEALSINKLALNYNQQFILGRNLLQMAIGGEYISQSFMEDLFKKLSKYSEPSTNENHVFNGILFEMYYDSLGEFRGKNAKNHYKEEILALRKAPQYQNSFLFINQLLKNEKYDLIYYPNDKDIDIDITIVLNNEISLNAEYLDGKTIKHANTCTDIVYQGVSIIKEIKSFSHNNILVKGKNLEGTISSFLTAPCELVRIHGSKDFEAIYLKPNESELDW